MSLYLRGLSRSDVLCLVGMVFCCLCGFAQIAKYVSGIAQVLFVAAIAACTILVMLWLRWFQLRGREDLNRFWLAALWCLFALLFVLFFPLANHHTAGAGSDRADALHLAVSALLHGHYPYRALTYLGNPITPLPGAVLLAVPFFLIGNVSLQNLLWLALFLGFSRWFFGTRSAAVAYVLILLGASASNLDDFVVGGDFLINAIYVCIAMALVSATHDSVNANWKQIASAVFLGVAIDSRPVYFVVVPLLVAYVWQRCDRAAALRLLMISGAVAASLSVPFYLYDPAHFSPFHVRNKLDFLPAWLHAVWLLPVLALLIACIGFVVHLTRMRVFLLTGVSLLAMFGPPAVLAWSLAPFTVEGWFGLGLLSIPAMFLSLWVLAVFEQNTFSLRSRITDQPAIAAS